MSSSSDDDYYALLTDVKTTKSKRNSVGLVSLSIFELQKCLDDLRVTVQDSQRLGVFAFDTSITNFTSLCNVIRERGTDIDSYGVQDLESYKAFMAAQFFGLCTLMNTCMKHLEGKLSHDPYAHVFPDLLPRYMCVLSGLNDLISVSREDMYVEGFQKLLKNRSLSIMIFFARCVVHEEYDAWLILNIDLVPSDHRFLCCRTMFGLDQVDEHSNLHVLDRENLFNESFDFIIGQPASFFKKRLFLGFKGDEAFGFGVVKQWLVAVCQEIFSPDKLLFVCCAHNSRRFLPREGDSSLQYFKFAGKMVGLALKYKIALGIFLDRVFYNLLAANLGTRSVGKAVTLEDIKDTDPSLYSCYNDILNSEEVEKLELYFVRTRDVSGQTITDPLCENGENELVTAENRVHYVNLLVHHQFVKGILLRVRHFAMGFADILSGLASERGSYFQTATYFRCMKLEDIDGLLGGSDSPISVSEWKANTDYGQGLDESVPLIKWFWEVVEEMTPKQRRNLLFFWTAEMYLPFKGFEGFDEMPKIVLSLKPSPAYPHSHTCFRMMLIPSYPTKDLLEDRFRFITDDSFAQSGTFE